VKVRDKVPDRVLNKTYGLRKSHHTINGIGVIRELFTLHRCHTESVCVQCKTGHGDVVSDDSPTHIPCTISNIPSFGRVLEGAGAFGPKKLVIPLQSISIGRPVH
jgi:hypothetical protein